MSPPAPVHKKVICLGVSRTGTTSLGDALESLGMLRLTWSRDFSLPLLESVARGDLAPVFEVADRYDALEDLPWPLIYRELDARYPDALFILTVRKDETAWARSIELHTLGKSRARFEAFRIVFGRHFYQDDPAAFLAKYRAHNDEVRRYFAEKYPGGGKLLEMCLEHGDGWERLCAFLGVSMPATPFPHVNSRRRTWYRKLYARLLARMRPA